MKKRLHPELAINESLAYRRQLSDLGSPADYDRIGARLDRSRQILGTYTTAGQLRDAYQNEEQQEIDSALWDAPYINPYQAAEVYENVFDKYSKYKDMAETIAIGGLFGLVQVDMPRSMGVLELASGIKNRDFKRLFKRMIDTQIKGNNLITPSPTFEKIYIRHTHAPDGYSHRENKERRERWAAEERGEYDYEDSLLLAELQAERVPEDLKKAGLL